MFRVVNTLEKSGSAGYNVLYIVVYIQIGLLWMKFLAIYDLP